MFNLYLKNFSGKSSLKFIVESRSLWVEISVRFLKFSFPYFVVWLGGGSFPITYVFRLSDRWKHECCRRGPDRVTGWSFPSKRIGQESIYHVT